MSHYTNSLLSSLRPEDLDLLGPLTAVDLPKRMVLEARNRPVQSIFFPESGLVSMTLKGAGDDQAEVGAFGYEGMSGLSVLTCGENPPTETFMQIAGAGHSMPKAALEEAAATSATLRGCFLAYSYAFGIQVASTALSNSRQSIEARLARWLLMADDRVPSHDVPLSHEYLAMMLGVRRAGVTGATQKLVTHGFIAKHRGTIHIADRGGLMNLCRGSYLKPGALRPEWEPAVRSGEGAV